jgi:phosphopantetheinyl transferase
LYYFAICKALQCKIYKEILPLFYQHNINEDEKLGVWKIEEDEAFFLSKVPLNRDISHQHKRLQHLAGRYLLQHLFPDFPYDLIQIADTRKPFLFNEAYHFSISHCSDYAAALVSRWRRVGVDIELVTPTIQKIQHKFLTDNEISYLNETHFNRNGQTKKEVTTSMLEPDLQASSSYAPAVTNTNHQVTTIGTLASPQANRDSVNLDLLTLCWSAKEAMYKWYGNGAVDFKKHMQLTGIAGEEAPGWIPGSFIFQKEKPVPLQIRSRFFGDVVLTYVIS